LNAETLFQQALELPADQRAAFLLQACGAPELRARVAALLAADKQASAIPGFKAPDLTFSQASGPPAGAGEKHLRARDRKLEQGTWVAERYRLLQPLVTEIEQSRSEN